MVAFIVRRTLIGAFTIFLIGTLSFFIVSLPAGDYITSYISQLESYGDDIGIETAESLRETYGIDQPIYVQWWKWATRFVRGDFGFSLEHKKLIQFPVAFSISKFSLSNAPPIKGTPTKNKKKLTSNRFIPLY